MDLSKHIWEGWTVQSFIDDLEPIFNMIMNNNSWQKPFTTKSEVKEWCKYNQSGYKKHIPEVVNYFCKKYNIK
jgi:type II secretory pathway component PulC